MDKKKIIIIGATSSIAEQCAQLWAATAPVEMLLVARNLQKIEIIAADLRARSPDSEITVSQVNFVDPLAIATLVEEMSLAKKLTSR